MRAALPGSVLALFAHPDDAELWAGGTLAHHAAHAPVTVAVPFRDPVRDAEATKGAEILGTALRQLPVLDSSAIHQLLVDVRPDLVITHPLRDVHPEHRAVANEVLQALPEAVIATGFPRRLYTCDTYNSLTLDGPLNATTIVDVTHTFATKMKALREHTSQPIEEHFGPMAENLGRLWGARIGSARGEAFTAVPVLGRLPPATQL